MFQTVHGFARLGAQEPAGKPRGALSCDLICSRKTLIQRFHAQVDLSPKAVASILRLAHAVERNRTPPLGLSTKTSGRCGFLRCKIRKGTRDERGTTTPIPE